MIESNTVNVTEDAPDDAGWRIWDDAEFWLVLWLIEATATAICLVPPDADRILQRKAERLVTVIRAHQNLRDLRRVAGSGIGADARLIISRERLAARLDALQASGHHMRFRPSGEISGVEFSLSPPAR